MAGLMQLLIIILLAIIISMIYSWVKNKQVFYVCKYCWRLVRSCDYEEHIKRICPDLPVDCVLECGECIARKMMRDHCQQQCNNGKRMLLQQEEHQFVITCFAVKESDENCN